MFAEKDEVIMLDASVGTGNLLFTVLNNSRINVKKLYGVDPSYEALGLHSLC